MTSWTELESAMAAGHTRFSTRRYRAHLDTDFTSLDQFARGRNGPRPSRTAAEKCRAATVPFLIGVTTGDIDDAEESIAELDELATSADVVVLDKIIQRRPQIDPKTVLGKGKLDDLLIRSMRLGADLIIFDTELSPAQVRS